MEQCWADVIDELIIALMMMRWRKEAWIMCCREDGDFIREGKERETMFGYFSIVSINNDDDN